MPSSVVVVFRSRLREDVEEAYAPVAKRMEALARLQPGFRSFKSFAAADGERLALAEFDSAEAATDWGTHPEHRVAQKMGREQFYSEFQLQVAEVLRETCFPDSHD